MGIVDPAMTKIKCWGKQMAKLVDAMGEKRLVPARENHDLLREMARGTEIKKRALPLVERAVTMTVEENISYRFEACSV